MKVIEDLVRKHVCGGLRVLDVGTGSGGSIRLIIDACGSMQHYVVGVDVNLERLFKAKLTLNNYLTDLIGCDASSLPFRDMAFDAVLMALTLHEVEVKLAEGIVNEVRRVLRGEGTLLFIDKCLFKPASPSEELTLLTEEAYHKAIEYVEGIKLLGLRRPEEYMDMLKRGGFTIRLSNLITGKHISSEEFIRSWGKDTIRLLNEIKDRKRKSELNNLVSRTKLIGSKYGYGPSKLLVAVLTKQ